MQDRIEAAGESGFIDLTVYPAQSSARDVSLTPANSYMQDKLAQEGAVVS